MTLMQFIVLLLATSVCLSLIMAFAWAVQQRTNNSGWVDTVWTFGLGAVGVAGALLPIGGWLPRQVLVSLLILAWSLRLGVHIAARTSGIVDDPRYAELQRNWGTDARRRMFWLLQNQAWVSIPLALSMILAAHVPVAAFRLQDALALVVLLAGIGGEALADGQLRRFRANPANKGGICDVGLWRWSRHPNYFFEWVGWLAYPLFAIDLAGHYPVGWLALLGPACMYWLLVYISGIPPLEEHMLRVRGDAFRAYQRQVGAFFPSPPRERV
jgi:steroid 5-alpha reductase family enzyme